MYTILLPTIKISILIFYCRIFETRKFKTAAKIVGVFIILYMLAFVVTEFCICQPLDHYWNQVLGETGKCFNYNKWSMAGAIINIITDAAILFLPIPMIWKLRVSKNQKIALSGVFLLGSL